MVTHDRPRDGEIAAPLSKRLDMPVETRREVGAVDGQRLDTVVPRD
jgi:hypothetical protein